MIAEGQAAARWGEAERALSILRADPLCVDARLVGAVRGDTAGLVTARTALGTLRLVEMFSGEQLPRIC